MEAAGAALTRPSGRTAGSTARTALNASPGLHPPLPGRPATVETRDAAGSIDVQNSTGRPGVDEPEEPTGKKAQQPARPDAPEVSSAVRDAQRDRAELADPGGIEGALEEAAQDANGGGTPG